MYICVMMVSVFLCGSVHAMDNEQLPASRPTSEGYDSFTFAELTRLGATPKQLREAIIKAWHTDRAYGGRAFLKDHLVNVDGYSTYLDKKYPDMSPDIKAGKIQYLQLVNDGKRSAWGMQASKD